MLGTVLFLILALIAVLAAIGMLTSSNAVHAALFLVINLMCIALFYLGLSAPFLAMVQITVYAGAIMVLFLFVIMLLGAESVPLTSTLRWQTPLAAILMIVLVVTAGFMLFSPNANLSLGSIGPDTPPSLSADEGTAATESTELTFGGPHDLGKALFERYTLPFELTGVLLLVAMIGAVVLTKEEKQPDDAPEEGAAAD